MGTGIHLEDGDGNVYDLVDLAGANMVNNNLAVVLVDGNGNTLTSTTGAYVQGNVASGATDSGNPVKVGGKYNATLPTFADGQRGDVQIDAKGYARVSQRSGNTTGADGNGNAYSTLADDIGASVQVRVKPELLNGAGSTTWDRQRNNHEITLLASAARTATSTGADQTNYNQRDAYIVIDVTAGAAAPGLTPALQMKDTLSGKYVQVHANLTKITATGTYVYFFGKGTPTAAGGVTAVSGFPLPRAWRLVMTADDATSYTYSASVNYIV